MRGAPRRTSPYETVLPLTVGHLRLLRVNGISLDLDGYRVFSGDREVALSPKEFSLLRTLIENAGRALSRRTLLDAVWGPGYPDHNKTLEVHIRRLRNKLDPGQSTPRIRTVRGVGYVLDLELAELNDRSRL